MVQGLGLTERDVGVESLRRVWRFVLLAWGILSGLIPGVCVQQVHGRDRYAGKNYCDI